LSIGSSKSQPVSTNCTFSDNNLTSRCDVWSDLKIHHENQEINIENAENRENVSTFVVVEKVVPYFPQGIDKYFPNLKALQITSSGLKKISSTDLQSFVHLEFLNLDYNDIEILEANLFKFNKNLSTISLNSNKIMEVDPTAFDGLVRIEKLEVILNICHSANAVNKAQVMLIINNLKTKCWSESLDIKKFILGVSKMDNGLEVLGKMMNFTSYEVINRMSHNNSSTSCDSSNYEQKVGILGLIAYSDMTIMDFLIILNTLLLLIMAITVITSKCSPKNPNNVHNKIYEKVNKTSLKNKFDTKLTKSMEPLENNYHENDENYDKISERFNQKEYSAVLNSEECEAVYCDNEELYSEVRNLTEASQDQEKSTTDGKGCEKESEKDAIYTEVIKRSSGWI